MWQHLGALSDDGQVYCQGFVQMLLIMLLVPYHMPHIWVFWLIKAALFFALFCSEAPCLWIRRSPCSAFVSAWRVRQAIRALA